VLAIEVALYRHGAVPSDASDDGRGARRCSRDALARHVPVDALVGCVSIVGFAEVNRFSIVRSIATSLLAVLLIAVTIAA
jgi:hypothetical protein